MDRGVVNPSVRILRDDHTASDVFSGVARGVEKHREHPLKINPAGNDHLLAWAILNDPRFHRDGQAPLHISADPREIAFEDGLHIGQAHQEVGTDRDRGDYGV